MQRKQQENPQQKPQKTERLEARVSVQQKELLQHAADMLGRSLTDFILSVSQEAAQKVIREQQLIELSAKESRDFVEALNNASEPNEALQNAFSRYQAKRS